MTADGAEARAAATLARMQLVIMGTWAAFAIFDAAATRPYSLSIDAGAIALTALAWQLTLRRPQRWSPLMDATAAISTVGIVLSSWASGGDEGYAWWFLAATPLFAAHVGGRRAGLRWTVFGALGVLAACLVTVGPQEMVPTVADRVFSGLLLVVVCAAFGLLSRAQTDAHLAQLAEAARARGELLATIGHEVRTPLHGMVGTATILADTELGPEQREMLSTIRASGKALGRIVDDVLDVARLEAGQLRIEPHWVDLTSVIEDVVDLFAGDAAAKDVTLVAIVDDARRMHVQADGNRVRQILSNLVGNAVKFTERGHVVVRARARPSEQEGRVAVTIDVEDTGPGLPTAQISALFRPFEQPDPRLARIHGGSGLGLSLARHLAERMGGALTVDTAREVGARFTFTLAPSAPKAESLSNDRQALAREARFGEGAPRSGAGGVFQDPSETESLPPLTRNARVLLLETNPLRAEAFRSSAAAIGAPAEVASTVEEAVARVVRETPFVTLVSGSGAENPEAARVALRAALGARRPIVLVLPQDQVGGYLATEVARAFDGTTLEPLRRSRLRALLDEASLAHASQPTPLLLGKALVVDDDATSRRLLSVMLERRGFVVAPCETGDEALAALAREELDLAFCDLNMPNMDGVELRERAKAVPSAKQTCFVIVSASAREEDRRRCLEAGFAGYLTKPFEPAQLDEVIARARRRGASPPSAPAAQTSATEEAVLDAALVARTRELLGEETDELLQELWDNTTTLIRALRDAPDDTREVERAAHTIASGALQVGLAKLGERARALELAAEDRPAGEVVAEADALLDLLERSYEALGVRTPSSVEPERAPIARIRFVGHLDAAAVERELGRARRSGRGLARVLVDCAAMSSYDPDARLAFERWASRSIPPEGSGGPPDAIAFVTRNHLWGAVVRAMAAASGTPMRAFWSVAEAEAWLGEPAP